jgi:hypothetical protein
VKTLPRNVVAVLIAPSGAIVSRHLSVSTAILARERAQGDLQLRLASNGVLERPVPTRARLDDDSWRTITAQVTP